jgi:hypothetical protein
LLIAATQSFNLQKQAVLIAWELAGKEQCTTATAANAQPLHRELTVEGIGGGAVHLELVAAKTAAETLPASLQAALHTASSAYVPAETLLDFDHSARAPQRWFAVSQYVAVWQDTEGQYSSPLSLEALQSTVAVAAQHCGCSVPLLVLVPDEAGQRSRRRRRQQATDAAAANDDASSSSSETESLAKVLEEDSMVLIR